MLELAVKDIKTNIIVLCMLRKLNRDMKDILYFNLLESKRQSASGGRGRRRGEADSDLSRELDMGLGPRTPRS